MCGRGCYYILDNLRCNSEKVDFIRFKRQSFIIMSMIAVLIVCFSTLPFYTIQKSRTIKDFWDLKSYC